MVQVSVYHFNTVRLTNGLICETETDWRTENRLVVAKGEVGRGGMGWECGISCLVPKSCLTL